MITKDAITITLAKNSDLQVIVPAESTEYEPYILKGGVFYDTMFFRPIDGAPKQKMLCDEHRRQAKMLLGEAREKWDAMQEAKSKSGEGISVQPAPQPQQAPAPQPIATAPSPTGTLDQIITQLVAQSAQAAVVEGAKPAIDAYIKETYGTLPQIVRVENNGMVREIKGVVAKEFDTILRCISADMAVYLYGPSGCGKNVICKQVAEALGLDFYFSNALTQEYQLTGFVDANGNYQETPFYKAFTQGGLFMLDEMDASVPEVLVKLNSALANGWFDFPGKGNVIAHKDFRVIAAGNTVGTGADSEYTGRYQLDAASLDRFVFKGITYDERVEDAIADSDSDIVEFIRDFRDALKRSGILKPITYRAVAAMTKIKDVIKDKAEVARLSVVKGMSDDDLGLVLNNLAHKSNPYAVALNS